MRILFGFLVVLCVVGGPCGCRPASEKPSGIILFISDGTSQELLTATRCYAYGARGRLALEAFPRSAIVRTASASHVVTDSAAGATAMARGIKAENRVLGQESAVAESAPPSLLDLAKAAGWSTGVVSDDSVTGATPAAFLVEHPRRDDHADIARKVVSALGRRADLVLGGGSRWFGGAGADRTSTKDRATVEETREALAKSGAAVFDTWESLLAHPSDERPVFGTFFPEEFPYYADGGRELRLGDLVRQAVEILRARGKPFLLLVEAALPDKASHLNSAKRAMTEVLEFDAALAWAATLPGVLVLATTDHNTGGLALNGYPPIGFQGDALLRPHPATGTMFLTWASGPGANTSVSGEDPAEYLKPAQTQPALLPMGSALHTGGDVWLIASGPGSEGVGGYLENTDIHHIIARALGSAGQR